MAFASQQENFCLLAIGKQDSWITQEEGANVKKLFLKMKILSNLLRNIIKKEEKIEESMIKNPYLKNLSYFSMILIKLSETAVIQ